LRATAIDRCKLPVEIYETAYQLHTNLKQTAAAARDAEHVVALEPGNVEWLVKHAVASSITGPSAAGIGDYLEILKKYPESISALESLGRIYCELGREDIADKLMDRGPVPMWEAATKADMVPLESGATVCRRIMFGGLGQYSYRWTGFQPPIPNLSPPLATAERK
jgi:hypothetical protein